MKKLYTLIFLLFFGTGLTANDVFRGYLLTLDGSILTGLIGQDLYDGSYGTHILFINDFGTPYSIHPRLIKGFVYQNDKQVITFVSKVIDKRWTFLETIHEGEGLSLYLTPDEKTVADINGIAYPTSIRRGRDFYLQAAKRKKMIRVKRLGFRKQMRQLLRWRAPKLTKKIGEPGYRYRNMETIIREYNQEYKTTRYML